MKEKLIYVNPVKEQRAKDILALVTGKTVIKTKDDEETREIFSAHLAEAEVDTKSDDALPCIYEKLGGLIRTPAEQKAADAAKIEMQKKGKKRMIQ